MISLRQPWPGRITTHRLWHLDSRFHQFSRPDKVLAIRILAPRATLHTSCSKTGSFGTRLKNLRSHSLPCSFSVLRIARWRFSIIDFSVDVVSMSPLVMASATFFQAFRDSKSSCCSMGAICRGVGFVAAWSKVSTT